MDMAENVKERYGLAKERISEIAVEDGIQGEYGVYFRNMAVFLGEIGDAYNYAESGKLYEASLEELQERNRSLYRDILPENYERSYGNPSYAVKKLGDGYGQLLSFLYAELRSLIAFAYEKDLFEMTIRMELFLEIYSAFVCAGEEGEEVPDYEELRQIVYWFVSDYSELSAKRGSGSSLARRKILS